MQAFHKGIGQCYGLYYITCIWTKIWLLAVSTKSPVMITLHSKLHEKRFYFLFKLHPGNGQLVRRRCTIANQFDLSRRTCWHVWTNTQQIGLLSLTWVNISNSILAVNRRMSYAVAMNMDNTDTGSHEKKTQGCLQILHLACKNEGFKTLCCDSVCLCNATLPFFVCYYQSK